MIHATEAKPLSRAASSLLFTGLDLATKPNGKYPSEDFEKVLARSAFDGEFVHTTAKELQLARGEDIDLQHRSPLAKSLLYHLRNLSPDAIDAQFDGVRVATFAHARRQRAFARPVDVALDIHEWLYYGSAETPHVCAINPGRGTNLAYAFVTLCIVDPAVRFTLACESIEADDSRTLRESIRRVITTAQQFVQINRVYCDRGFYRVALVETLTDLDVDFVVRAPKTVGVKRALDAHDEATFVTSYEMVRKNPPTGRVPVTLVVVPHRSRDDDSFCLVTNCAVSVESAEPLAEAYRRRWGIETSYRKIGEFLPRTSSPTFAVRLFEFLFAVALYNLWILVCLCLVEQRVLTDRPAVSTALFRLFVLSIPDG
ncbi:transposase [Salinigranum halophilum]|uniref:transposase n=1 Tax=Salinigranum halophilum TaxID=2565931 RepID=UPI0010A7F384|nr:transposase [Salinigranum halophilum]